jgi:sec-independent protein translocase protein TatB
VFGMSLGEIMIIAIIAILFIGPDKLPEAMVKVAKFFRSFKKTIHETKETIEQEIHLTELKEEALSYKKDLDDVVNEYKFDDDLNIMDDISSSIKDVESSVKEIATKSDKPKKKKVKSKKKKKEISKDSSDV